SGFSPAPASSAPASLSPLSRQTRGDDGSTASAAIERVLGDPTWELIPLKNAHEQAAALPAHATVSVTASPAKGIEATVDLAIELEKAGFRAVPHLSARMIRDEHQLADLLAMLID